jgi:hypothetical protein
MLAMFFLGSAKVENYFETTKSLALATFKVVGLQLSSHLHSTLPPSFRSRVTIMTQLRNDHDATAKRS